jgi:hypothetical protein
MTRTLHEPGCSIEIHTQLTSTFSASQNLTHFRAIIIETQKRWESDHDEQTYWHKEGTSTWLWGTAILTAATVPPYVRGSVPVQER